ncbi:MAG: hypothetical protein KR126chlam5_00165 [Candidatus Anoxychlamydiales bacterium]|nr:hypothetical protein [Candidatus Anoxychlamydiales bacterium]
MAKHQLSEHFNALFYKINPKDTYEKKASNAYQTIKYIISNFHGPLKALNPDCFIQGSYKQQTAIHSINDLDIIVLCKKNLAGNQRKNRDELFQMVADPFLSDYRYKDKVCYNANSMCIKIDHAIRIEILPTIKRKFEEEPFYLFRPEKNRWERGYARRHQELLSYKNKGNLNFIPAIKLFKHIRSIFKIESVSFHIECLLYSLPTKCFLGSPVEYMTKLLNYIAIRNVDKWYEKSIKTPCEERCLFNNLEWNLTNWRFFHEIISSLAPLANEAIRVQNQVRAIALWQKIFGSNFFPSKVES